MRFATGTLGREIDGVRVLEVRGRNSGAWRAVPVKPLDVEGRRYLVSLHGESEWVRNLRASPSARLRFGRRVERIHAVEVPPPERVPALREYVRRASRQTTRDLLAGGAEEASHAHFLAVAEDHPVFALDLRPA